MSYCHKCGTKNDEESSFCESCGNKIKELIQETERSIKKSHKGLFIFIIFLLIIGYIVLDIWAMTQLQPVINADSILNSVSNFEGNTGLTSASASTTIRIENPTFVPIIAGKVVYDAGYGTTKVVEGKTGMVIVGPYATQDLPADVKVSYVNAGVAGFKGIKNAIFGGDDKINANAYMDVGITKFQLGRYER
ncbi:zinc ribbon domain-containing protein [Candidatus Pacearchaeota archaeon]|nr:zinc ribbon domain-containing protein [Candidatus Pacearchaeota archaeon]